MDQKTVHNENDEEQIRFKYQTVGIPFHDTLVQVDRDVIGRETQ